MEYRKGHALESHSAVIGDGHFKVTLRETTEAFNLNGVAFSRAKMAKWTQGNASLQMFAEMVCTSWPIVMDDRTKWKDEEARVYIVTKLRRMYESVGVWGETKAVSAADFCHAFAKWIANRTGDRYLMERMARIAVAMLKKSMSQDNGILAALEQAIMDAIKSGNAQVIDLNDLLNQKPPKNKLN